MPKVILILPGTFMARGGEQVEIETFDEICVKFTDFIFGQNIITPSGQKALFRGISLHPHKPEKGMVLWYLKEETSGITYWECSESLSPEYLHKAGFHRLREKQEVK